MSKIKKSDLLSMIQEQNDVIAKLIRQVNCHHKDIIRLEGVIEPAPQLIAIRSKRDIAKELLEVDLSSELTGSELCKAMLARGDKYVMCAVNDDGQEDTLLDGFYAAVQSVENGVGFYGYDNYWGYATPINNQGEPLTSSEVGL